MTVLYILAALVVSFVFSAIGIRPSHKSAPRQYGVPFANNMRDLEKRTRKGYAH